MSNLIKWRAPSPSLRRLEQALTFDRDRGAASSGEGHGLAHPGPRQMVPLPPRVDLLRVCAQHGGNPWAAVYLLNGAGGYDYSTSVVISKTLFRTQYAPGVAETVVWNSAWIDEETCALCGVPSFGAVQCGVCRQLVCRGRSTGQYFRCHCGAEGWIQKSAFDNLGIVPRVAR